MYTFGTGEVFATQVVDGSTADVQPQLLADLFTDAWLKCQSDCRWCTPKYHRMLGDCIEATAAGAGQQIGLDSSTAGLQAKWFDAQFCDLTPRPQNSNHTWNFLCHTEVHNILVEGPSTLYASLSTESVVVCYHSMKSCGPPRWFTHLLF